MLNSKGLNSQKGFTLIELMVVISIMMIFSTFLVVNINGQRAGRDLQIAQSQLGSNIRKIQSYAFSGRTLPGGQQVSYYIFKFATSTPNQYKLQALVNASSNPQVVDVETDTLPGSVQIGSISITRPSSPTNPVTDNCAILAFQLPFGKMYSDAISNSQGISCDSPQTPVYTVGSTDAYNQILLFVQNTDNYPVATDFSSFDISLINSANLSLPAKVVHVNGITGTSTNQ